MNDSKELKPGDLAIIIKSVEGKAIGKIVECMRIDHINATYGTIWWVKAPSNMKVVGIDEGTNMGLCPQDWMRKIPNDPLQDDDFGVDINIKSTDSVSA